MNKKNPNRFTVQFNTGKPNEEQAREILESQPARKRAQYIAEAIECYKQKKRVINIAHHIYCIIEKQ